MDYLALNQQRLPRSKVSANVLPVKNGRIIVAPTKKQSSIISLSSKESGKLKLGLKGESTANSPASRGGYVRDEAENEELNRMRQRKFKMSSQILQGFKEIIDNGFLARKID